MREFGLRKQKLGYYLLIKQRSVWWSGQCWNNNTPPLSMLLDNPQQGCACVYYVCCCRSTVCLFCVSLYALSCQRTVCLHVCGFSKSFLWVNCVTSPPSFSRFPLNTGPPFLEGQPQTGTQVIPSIHNNRTQPSMSCYH